MRSAPTPVLLAPVLALVLAACGVRGGPAGSDARAGDVGAGDPGRRCVGVAELPGGGAVPAHAGGTILAWDLPDPAVRDGFDPARIQRLLPPDTVGGGPIDDPCFDDPSVAAEWLTDRSPVLAVEVDGDVRAYPLGIVTRHEVVNDVVGGRPVVATYCPLCNSGLAFLREVDGTELTFGTSGGLYQSNLVMWDRQTGTLWAQFTGVALIGDLVGAELEQVPTALLSFAEFREVAPEGLVLSPATTGGRYGDNPYPNYDDIGVDFGIFEGPTDARLEPNARVVGLGGGDDPVAVPLDRLREEPVVDLEVAGRAVTVWWAPGAASALDTPRVDDGRDVGQAVAFDRRLGAEVLAFAVDPADPTLFVDEGGSRWNLRGVAVDGPRAGSRLDAVAHEDTFWFVWFAFHQQTRIAAA